MNLSMALNSFKRQEYKFLKAIILRLRRETWDKTDLDFIESKFDYFIRKTKLDKINILRKGEVMLGEYSEVNLSNIQDVRDLIYKCIANIDEISSPICVAIISALNTLALAEINGKLNYNNIKKERNDDYDMS